MPVILARRIWPPERALLATEGGFVVGTDFFIFQANSGGGPNLDFTRGYAVG
ncbi:hypothetical protein [Adhaeretor mobilis]|uniref:hypothetical protein n=1 Tax=Adhaeretor mobilis TaxID=1930276 RepID=UPI001C54FC20|nr:hypothetical protein [Adhaeretor mobilis]